LPERLGANENDPGRGRFITITINLAVAYQAIDFT
jgi:hypothetical protein